MVNIAEELFSNPIFISVLIAGISSQLLKVIIMSINHKQKLGFKDLVVTGKMPSSHSALVSSLTLIIFLEQGLSALFFVVLTFSLIVLRDSIGVRRSVGEEGKLIEKIAKSEKIRLGKFNYSLGHTPIEVVVGLFIGIIGAIFSYLVF
jgi:uncharacterized protein